MSVNVAVGHRSGGRLATMLVATKKVFIFFFIFHFSFFIFSVATFSPRRSARIKKLIYYFNTQCYILFNTIWGHCNVCNSCASRETNLLVSKIPQSNHYSSLIKYIWYQVYIGTSGRRSSRSGFGRSTGNDVSGYYFLLFWHERSALQLVGVAVGRLATTLVATIFIICFPFFSPPSSPFLIEGVLGSKNLFGKSWSERPIT